jgi:hypothetical protein
MARVHQYLDLPAFDAVRSLPPRERGTIPHSERVLVLCPYAKEYQKANWKRVLDGLDFVLASAFSKGPKPAVSRVLDLNVSSPRLVSQMIYEAIRRIEMCVADWTDWRPNVFFELGVRLAVSKEGAVCIIDRMQLPAPAEDDPGSPRDAADTQRRRLLNLFAPIEYDPFSLDKEPYRLVLRRFEEKGEGGLPSGHTYKLVADSIDIEMEAGTLPVHRQLIEEADLLTSDESEGKSSVLYPENQELVKTVERGVTERLWAAWYYLKHRYSEEQIRADPRLASEFVEVGQRLARRLRLIDFEQGMKIAQEVKRFREVVVHDRQSS